MDHRRAAIREQLASLGIATGAYFSPHLMEQPYFKKLCVAGPMPVCDDVSARMISLPLFDTMTYHEVEHVADLLQSVMGFSAAHSGQRKPVRSHHPVAPNYANQS
jgi:dTDP-4-amino-4,6-dideoxygalactose transaminase